MTKINLADLPDSVLGRMVRAALVTVLVDTQRPARETAQGDKLVRDDQRDLLLAADRERIQQEPEVFTLPGVLVKGVAVPLLDVAEQSLGETPGAKDRSPYNKVLHRLGQPLLEAETCTWSTLRDLHLEWARSPQEEPVVEPTVTVSVGLDVDGPAKTKRDALVATLGCSPEYAEALMTRIGGK